MAQGEVQKARETLLVVAQRFADAAADLIDHPGCPELISGMLSELMAETHNELGDGVAEDYRLTFAVFVQHAASNR